METLRYTISIHAPKEKVWDTMLGDASYREWTSAFNPGSYFKGDWSVGSKMLFLGPDPRDGVEGGIVARVVENKPYEFVSVQHYGLYKNGVEDTESDEVKKWANATESYTFKETDGVTEVVVDMSGASELADMFNETWPKALEKLKEISERA